MAENVRGLLSDTDEQNTQLHGGKNDHIQKHDIHLVGNIVFRAVVGKVSARTTIIIFIYTADFTRQAEACLKKKFYKH